MIHNVYGISSIFLQKILDFPFQSIVFYHSSHTWQRNFLKVSNNICSFQSIDLVLFYPLLNLEESHYEIVRRIGMKATIKVAQTAYSLPIQGWPEENHFNSYFKNHFFSYFMFLHLIHLIQHLHRCFSYFSMTFFFLYDFLSTFHIIDNRWQTFWMILFL